MQNLSEFCKEVKITLEKHQKEKQLLNSSQGKDIVVFIGNTGAGKTTLFNQLNGKEMEITRFGQLQLRNPNDPTAMKIGMGQQSETLLPQQAQIGSLVFYDLPGFEDNRGDVINVINGSFIKNIIEKAKTVRLVFVAGQDEMTASRGKSFMEILRIAKVLLPNNRAIEDSSILVVTKSSQDTSQGLIDYLKQVIGDNQMLNVWLTPNRVFPMSSKIIAQQKEDIMKSITRINAQKIDKLDIEAVYNTNVRNSFGELFRYIMSNSMDKVFNKQPKNEQNFDLVKKQMAYFQNSFQQEVTQDLGSSTIIQLLQPLSEEIYRVESSIFLINVNERKNMIVSQLDSKIKDEDIRLKNIKIQQQQNQHRQETQHQQEKHQQETQNYQDEIKRLQIDAANQVQHQQEEFIKKLEIIEQQNKFIIAKQSNVQYCRGNSDACALL